MMKTLVRGDKNYEAELTRLAHRGDADLATVEANVAAIVAEVRAGGDAALVSVTERIDGRRPEPLADGAHAMPTPLDEIDANARATKTIAARRIRALHEQQLESSRRFHDADGVELGWRIRPLDRAGIYAPGGKARYPSSVLMSAIPAHVAGVREIYVTTPRPTPEVLAAAALAGVKTVFDLGGAIAIAALAYGTETLPRVDKIVGPGNLYVTAAKKMVFGHVAIDGLAGPSEILVVADDQADPRAVAADLLSQAEHDEAAYPLLVTLSREMALRVITEVEAQLAVLPRRAIAEVSVREHGVVFVADDLVEAARVATILAAEHLALLVRDPDALFANIGAAGAAFLGDFTPEAAGDYLAGPSHVLPTGGAVRFASPLGVYDFQVRTSVIKYTRESLAAHASRITAFARIEGLEAHARAVEVREKK